MCGIAASDCYDQIQRTEIFMSNSTLDAITANITLMEARLQRAHSLARDALAAIKDGKQNLAIGTLLPMQEDMADTDALLKTILILHRARR